MGLFNIILIGFAYMLIFMAYQPLATFQETISRMETDTKDIVLVSGFIGLCIGYGSFTIFTLVVPYILNCLKIKTALGFLNFGVAILGLSLKFYNQYFYYFAFVAVGASLALAFFLLEMVLVKNSSADNIARNYAILRLFLCLSIFFGNTLIFGLYQGRDELKMYEVYTLVYAAFAFLFVGGLLTMLYRKSAAEIEDAERRDRGLEPEDSSGPFSLLSDTIIVPFILVFLYTGFELALWTGVFGACIGFIEKLDSRMEVIGLSGMIFAVGGVLACLSFLFIPQKTVPYLNTVLILVLNLLAYILIILGFPSTTPFGKTQDDSIIGVETHIVTVPSVVLGAACFALQIHISQMIRTIYDKNALAAFAIHRFVQGIGACISFGYAGYIDLHIQIYILIVLMVVATISMIILERFSRNNLVST